MLTDYHMHLVDDDDPYTDEVFERSRIEAYLDVARAAGIDEIGFTDHVYRFRQARDWTTTRSGWRAHSPISTATTTVWWQPAPPTCRSRWGSRSTTWPVARRR